MASLAAVRGCHARLRSTVHGESRQDPRSMVLSPVLPALCDVYMPFYRLFRMSVVSRRV